jgi:hypothetical protein
VAAVTLPKEPTPATVALVTTPANELEDLPTVRTSFFEQVPYVQVNR